MNAPIILRTKHEAMRSVPIATCYYVFIAIIKHFDDEIV